MNLFSSNGYIIRLPSNSQVMGFAMSDVFDRLGFLNFNTRLAIVTSVSTKETAAVQLRMMFEGKAFINVFGDNFGMMAVSGLYAGSSCDQYGYAGGFERMAYYFRTHRASNMPAPLTVLMGGIFSPMVYSAFLIDCTLATADPQLQIGNFSLQLAYVLPSSQIISSGQNLSYHSNFNASPTVSSFSNTSTLGYDPGTGVESLVDLQNSSYPVPPPELI